MRVITATREAQLFLGKRGENLATQIQFPVVEQWTEQFGEGRFELAYQRPTEDAPYPCIVDVEDGNVLWNITDVELAIPGTGRAELFYIVDEAIAISVQFICRIADSLASGTPPEPWENWLEEILSAASDAEDARDDAESARDEAVQAKTDAVDAKDLAVSSAESASADAERAETARSYAEIANDAAQDAKTYAIDAKDVAVAASAEAISAKEDALEASTDAINAASDAETYMNVALGAKDDAEDAKDTALGAVNDIANYANTASSAAATATAAATAATEAASTIDQVIPQHKGEYSATTTYVLNNIVTYQGATYWHYSATETTGTVPTNTGYWVLVNSATKSIASISKTGTSGLVDTYTITYTDNSTPSTFTVTNGQRGTQVTAGATLPASGMITGDLFVKTPDLELYQYSGSAWTYVADLRTPVDATLSNADEAADAKAVGDALDTKADKDGYYEDLSVGRADNLISNIALTDEVPYSFRTAGGALEISDPIREKAVVGLSSVWFQGVPLDTTKWTTSGSQMALTLTGRTYRVASASNTSSVKNIRSSSTNVVGNHIYFICADIKTSGATAYVSMGTNSASGTKSSPITVSSASDFVHKATIARATSDSVRFFLRINNGATSGSYAEFRDVQFIDLNRAFDKQVAEYLLARETASAGAGVETFRSFFPNKYYAVESTGEWMHTGLSKKVSVGFNAYDAETGKALVVGGHDYKIEGNYTSYAYTPFGGSATTILASDPDASERSFPFGGTLEFTGAESNLCVHLKWDGERDGEREEYKAHEYVLDDVTLKGFWCVDANGNIYAEGDTYDCYGTLTRKVGTVDIGDLDWSYDSTLQVFFANLDTMKNGGHIWCLSTYERYTGDELADMPNRTYWNNEEVYSSNNVVIKNTSYATVSAFVQALGQYPIYYELAEPTTESIDPFTELQRVDNWGTEQYVDYAVEHNTRDVSMPYGHVTEYPQDLKAKIEVAPNAPETDGLYLLKRENGINYYTPFDEGAIVPFVIPITRDNITGAYVSDVTWASILEAYNAGARLICSGYIDDASRVINIELKEVKDDNGYLTFLFETEEDMYYWTLISIHSPTEGNYPFAYVHHEATGKPLAISFTNSGSGWEADTTFQIAMGYFGEHVPLFGVEASVTNIAMALTAVSDTALEFSVIDPSSGDLIVFVFDANDDVTMTTYPQTPFVITLTQSGFDFSIDKTIAEITEAYQQNRQIWLQGVVTMDGSTFFNFRSQLNGVVRTGLVSDWYPPCYTFVVEYDMRNGSSVYHMVVSCYVNSDDEDYVRVTPIVLS